MNVILKNGEVIKVRAKKIITLLTLDSKPIKCAVTKSLAYDYLYNVTDWRTGALMAKNCISVKSAMVTGQERIGRHTYKEYMLRSRNYKIVNKES